MISHLSGSVLFVRDTFLVLDVHGVGYRVHCMPRTLDTARTTRELALHTHLAVREDAMELFGFEAPEELELFGQLISISGIGPRSALGILALESIEKLVSAIAHGDVGYLTKVSGVGKKSAEKIVLELRDKVSLMQLNDVANTQHEDADVLEALQALGYRADDARKAVRELPSEVTDQGERVKQALRILST